MGGSRGRQRRAVQPEPVTDDERAEYAAELAVPRPTNRVDCAGSERPCPWVGCRYHLGLDVTIGGKLLVPLGPEPWEVGATCALDEANAGPLTLEAIGRLLGLTRERVRQIEAKAYKRAKGSSLGRQFAADRLFRDED